MIFSEATLEQENIIANIRKCVSNSPSIFLCVQFEQCVCHTLSTCDLTYLHQLFRKNSKKLKATFSNYHLQIPQFFNVHPIALH